MLSRKDHVEHIIGKLLQDFEQGKMNRRQLIQSLAMAAAAAGAVAPIASAQEGKKGFQAIAVNHISYQVADYAKTRDFYSGLLGMKVSHDSGSQCYLSFGDTFLLARTPRSRDKSKAGTDGEPPAAPRTPRVDHMAYTIDNWDKGAVEAELRRWGLEPTPDTDNSFHVKDPDGYNLQISGKDMKA
jgi:catechol 2,3-dioxygenase-like lactoylglutathione lyase family enzyme